MAIQVGVIGDYDSSRPTHTATDAALAHAAQALSIAVTATWLPTPLLNRPEGQEMLLSFDALWCAPGSPYDSMDGALNAIRFAREQDRPFIGT